MQQAVLPETCRQAWLPMAQSKPLTQSLLSRVNGRRLQHILFTTHNWPSQVA